MFVRPWAQIHIVPEFLDKHTGYVTVAVDETVKVGFEKAKDVKIKVTDNFELALLRFSSSEVDTKVHLDYA